MLEGVCAGLLNQRWFRTLNLLALGLLLKNKKNPGLLVCNRQNLAYLRCIIVHICVYLEVITNTKQANICSASAVYLQCMSTSVMNPIKHV